MKRFNDSRSNGMSEAENGYWVEHREAALAVAAEHEKCQQLMDQYMELKRQIAKLEWQPVGISPNGVPVLVYGAKRLEWAVATYTHRDGWEVETCSDRHSIYPPKFWMPLPASPSEAKGDPP